MQTFLAILALVVKGLSTIFLGRAALKETAAANRRIGAAEAGNETADVIGGIADARANLPPEPTGAHDLAERMRRTAAEARRGTSFERPNE